MEVLLKTIKGTKVFINDEGKLTATFNGSQVIRNTLSEMESAISQASTTAVSPEWTAEEILEREG